MVLPTRKQVIVIEPPRGCTGQTIRRFMGIIAAQLLLDSKHGWELHQATVEVTHGDRYEKGD